jgi:hypothetical protein
MKFQGREDNEVEKKPKYGWLKAINRYQPVLGNPNNENCT